MNIKGELVYESIIHTREDALSQIDPILPWSVCKAFTAGLPRTSSAIAYQVVHFLLEKS